MKVNKRKLFNLVFLFVLFFMLFTKAVLFIDPDLGWQLQTGNLIRNSGIPQTDAFSYTMPSFPWIAFEWLFSLSVSCLYDYFSYYLIVLVGVVLMFVLVKILIRKILAYSENKYWEVSELLLLGITITFFGVRAQVLSWVYFAIALIIILNKKYEKYINLYPLLLILWVNSHGSFPLGLVILLLKITADFYSKHKLDKKIFVIFMASALATFINPYGARIWNEVFMTVSNRDLKWNIAEWMPILFIKNLPVLILIPLSTVLTHKYKKLYKPTTLLIYLFLLVMAISGMRHLVLWTILAVAMLPRALEKLRKDSADKKKFILFNEWLYTIVIIFVFGQFAIETKNAYINSRVFYPSDLAIEFLRENVNGNYYASYNWGGYLIWKLPEKKVFVDGRMPIWKRSKENTPDGELAYAFGTAKEVETDIEKRRQIFKQFNINTVIWYPEPKFSNTEKLVRKLLRIPENNLIKGLKDDGWVAVYKENNTVIYSNK